jgi:hypothetical protein
MSQVLFDVCTGAAPALGTSFTWAVTVGNHANRRMYVGASYSSDPGGTPTCTYNGVPCTLIASRAVTQFAYVWALTGPAVGTANVVITHVNSRVAAVGAIVVYDTDPVTPDDTPVTETDGDEAISVPSMAVGLVVDFLLEGAGNDAAVGGGQTERLDQLSATAGQRLFISTAPGTGSPVTMSWASLGVSTFHVGIAVRGVPPGGVGSVLQLATKGPVKVDGVGW